MHGKAEHEEHIQITFPSSNEVLYNDLKFPKLISFMFILSPFLQKVYHILQIKYSHLLPFYLYLIRQTGTKNKSC